MKHKYVYHGEEIAVIETDDILARIVGTVHTINGRNYRISGVIFHVSDSYYEIKVVDNE